MTIKKLSSFVFCEGGAVQDSRGVETYVFDPSEYHDQCPLCYSTTKKVYPANTKMVQYLVIEETYRDDEGNLITAPKRDENGDVILTKHERALGNAKHLCPECGIYVDDVDDEVFEGYILREYGDYPEAVRELDVLLAKLYEGYNDPDGKWNSPYGVVVPDHIVDGLLEFYAPPSQSE